MGNGIEGYGRLSQEEERERGTTMEQKIELRKDILRTIAKHNALELLDDGITFEVRSGANLTERPGLLDLLERCRRREVHTVIVFDVDRLTRDVADLKIILQAFFKGAIRLVTQRGIYTFDRHFDTTLLQILAVLGEKERRSFSYRRVAANEQRIRRGERSQGRAPYGYFWNKDLKRYEVIVAEYTILAEIFERIRYEGANTIANDLNKRGVPAPGLMRRVGASDRWLKGTVANLCRNPHYAGRPVKRRESDREGISQDLPRQQWIWSEEEITAYHPDDPDGLQRWFPITLDEWELIQDIMHERQMGGQPRTGLLTGLIKCCEGRPMVLHQDFYECRCEEVGRKHKGRHVRKPNIEAAAWRVVTAVCAEQPPKRMPGAKKPDRTQFDLAAARRDLREAEATIGDLTRRASFYVSLPHFGQAGHEAALREVTQKAQDLQSRIRILEEQQSTPDLNLLHQALNDIRAAGGIEALLPTIDPKDARELLRRVVKRIDLLAMPEGSGMTRDVKITVYDMGKGEQVKIERLEQQSKGKKRGPYLTRKRAKPETEGL